MKSKERRVSKVWQYFTKYNDGGSARCELCCHILSYKSSTTNLFKHLTRKHPGELQLMGESEDPRENLKEFIAIDASGEHGMGDGDSDGGEGDETREVDDGDGTPPKKMMKKHIIPPSKIKPEVISSNGVDYFIYTSDQPARRPMPPTLMKTRPSSLPMRTAASVTVERPAATATVTSNVGRPAVITDPEDEFAFFARFLAKRIRSLKDPYWQSCAINEINVAMHKVEMRRYEPPNKGLFGGSTSAAQTDPLSEVHLENQVVEEIVSHDEVVCETQGE